MSTALQIEATQLKRELLSTLVKNQKPNGEFETFALLRDANQFYIGASPFATAHIAYLLSGIENTEAKQIVSKAVEFLEQLDYTGKRIYKYWYGNTTGTAFPLLPIDLDDTSVVNQVLALQKRKTADPEILLNNRNSKQQFYTWLKPSVKTLLKHPSLFSVFAEYRKMYHIFLKNSDNLRMAEYNDTEIIVRMNVYIMLAVMDKEMSAAEKHFPFTLADTETELQSSLHYNNPAMYYLTLAKFQKHSHYFNEEKINELTNGIRNGIEQLANNFADVTALYLSLAFVKKLTTGDADKFLSLAKNEPGKNHSFRICVGNKKFKDYHEYCSPNFSVAMQICLINEIEKLKTA